MRIFYTANSAPRLLDTQQELNAAYRRLKTFVSSGEETLVLTCETDGDPEPYEMFLNRLRIRKTSGALSLQLTPDHWLDLNGAVDHLARYIEFFQFDEECGHHHPEYVEIPGYISPTSMSLIIEADSTWPGFDAE